jgi:hypothetical protein
MCTICIYEQELKSSETSCDKDIRCTVEAILVSPKWVGKTAKMLTTQNGLVVSAYLEYVEVKKEQFCMSGMNKAVETI